MLQAIDKIAKEFLESSREKSIRIISHHDTDGITSAAILAKALKRADKRFSIKILKSLNEENLKRELSKHEKEILFFTDLASGSLDYFQSLKNPIFILDHHEIDKTKLNGQIKIINPHLFGEEELSGAGLSYLFVKALSKDNIDLANLAIIGMVGDRLDTNLSKWNQQIINDTQDLTIKKSLLVYPATRPIKRTLEYCTSIYIPGVTGSSLGAMELLRDSGIPFEKNLFELTEEETSKLITAILLKRANIKRKEEIIGNLYVLKFFNKKEDARELSVMINACSRLGHSDIALSFCLENQKAKTQAEDLYTEYKQQLISALKVVEKLEKIKGNGFVILNAKSDIKDTIIGTVTSILSSSLDYEEGTVLIGMAYNQDKIKVSARIVGKEGRNLKEILEKITVNLKGEFGGHQNAAGCTICKEKEQEFIESLKRTLEIEVVKV
jgi:single-stranded-DNA-specific exonuclease